MATPSDSWTTNTAKGSGMVSGLRQVIAKRVTDIAAYTVILLLVLFCLLPFIWPILSAFGTKPENVSSVYLNWPASWTLQHFRNAVFGRGQALILLKNSLITTVGSVGIAVIVS